MRIGMMARILIAEPHPEVGDLLSRIVGRLGHRAVRLEDGDLGDAAADVAVLEPAADGALELASDLRAEGTHAVFVGIQPESPETGAAGTLSLQAA
jgi:CheY-like chemotaxis protein